MRLINRRKSAGQSTAEYAVTFAFVLGAAAGMQLYMKRTLQAKAKKGADAINAQVGSGDLTAFSKLEQYEPYYVDQDFVTTNDSTYGETWSKGAIERKGALSKVTRTGKQVDQGASTMTKDDVWK